MLLVLGTAAAFSRILSLMQASDVVLSLAGGLIENKVLLLLVLNIFLLFMGMIIDTSPNILIFTPVCCRWVSAVGIGPCPLRHHHGGQSGDWLCNSSGWGQSLCGPGSLWSPSGQIGQESNTLHGDVLYSLLLITYIPAISLVLL